MKRLLCLLLACALCLPAPACAGKGAEWDAADGGEVYGEAAGGSWRASPLALPQLYNDLPVFSRTKRLKKGTWRFAVQAKLADNTYSSWMSALLRVYDAGTREPVALREIYSTDFRRANSFEELDVAFVLDRTRELCFEVTWLNNCELTLGACRVEPCGSVPASPAEALLFPDTDTPEYREGVLYTFDLNALVRSLKDSVLAYDVSLLASCLQGLANRGAPRLWLRFSDAELLGRQQDDFWRGELLGDREQTELPSFGALLSLFSEFASGLAVWDAEVPATVNAACTAAGVEGLLPVRADGMLRALLRKHAPGLRDVLDLSARFRDGAAGTVWDTGVPSTGSAKNDVYLWAKATYLDTGRTNPTLMANHLDAFSWDKTGIFDTYYDLQLLFLANKDYYIRDKAFFFDLHVFPDSVPNDDADQEPGTDYETLTALLAAQNRLADGALVEVGGFVPWYVKYTSSAGYGDEGLPAPEACEWQGANLYGTYYMIKDADAYGTVNLANASVLSRLSVPARFLQSGAHSLSASEEELAARCRASGWLDAEGKVVPNHYVLVYMGDYDSAAWLSNGMPSIFSDRDLGFVPMVFPVNAGPSRRAAPVLDYMYRMAAEYGRGNVYFGGDHNGCGYLELSALEDASRPAELLGNTGDYFARTDEFWARYDLHFQSFLIDTRGRAGDRFPFSAALMREISAHAGLGVSCMTSATGGFSSGTFSVKLPDGSTVPWTRVVSVANGADAQGIEAVLVSEYSSSGTTSFSAFRNVCYTPSYLRRAWERAEASGARMVALDPAAFYFLADRFNAEDGNVFEF